jgi:hypothetical protein
MVTLWIRRTRPGDLAQLMDMVERCSFETLHRRLHGATGQPIRRELHRIANPTARHRSWVATDGSAIRATATLAWSSSGPPEIGVLVEDGWFRQGLGRSLWVEMAAEAERAAVPAVVARVQADNHGAVRFVRALAPHATAQLDGTELEMVMPVGKMQLRIGGRRGAGIGADRADRGLDRPPALAIQAGDAA